MQAKVSGLNNRKVVNVKFLSEYLAVSGSTIYNWKDLGMIPFMKINGSVRFDMDDINKWLETCKIGCDSEYNSILRLEARKGG
jgi:excisionase family DNA binding protein